MTSWDQGHEAVAKLAAAIERVNRPHETADRLVDHHSVRHFHADLGIDMAGDPRPDRQRGAPMVVTYRFAMSAVAMAAVARWKGHSLRPGPGLIKTAAILGVSQFCINFNSVYVAERFITSGIVATVFAILLIPNSLLAWALLGQRPSGRFAIGGAIAATGIALLFVHELQETRVGTSQVLAGLGLTLFGMLGASWAKVYQARESARQHPLLALLAWAMANRHRGRCDAGVGCRGAPTIDPSRPIGLASPLALAASVLCFSLYFRGTQDRAGRAAYSSVLVPIIAMGLSTVFEHYRWSLLAAAGGVLALGGMLVALSGHPRTTVAAPDAG